LLGALGLPGWVLASPGCNHLNGLSGTLADAHSVLLNSSDPAVNQGDLITLTTSGGPVNYRGNYLNMLDSTGGTVSGVEAGSGYVADFLDNNSGSSITYSISCTSVAPSISSITPSTAAPGQTVTITGSGFYGTVTVGLGNKVANFVVNNGGTITATVPDGSGTWPVVVLTDAGEYTGPQFTVQAPTAGDVTASVAFDSSNNTIPLNTSGNPTAVAVASLPSHGTAHASGTSISYTPASGYAGADSFTYTATSSAGTSAPATVTITVNPPPAPTVSAVSATAPYGTATAINLASAISGQDVTGINIASQPSHGTVSVSGETVTYTPAASFYGGTDSFTYTATNPGGTSSPATVTVSVSQVAAPTVAAQSATVPYNTATNINLAGAISGTDITGITIASQPTHGSVSVSGETVTYTPSATFYGGTDSFTYTATNPGGTSSPATVTLTVSAVAIPTVAAKSVTTPYNTATNINLATAISGTDVTGVAVTGNPSHGTVSVSGETVTYTPSATFYGGTDSFTYIATNPGGNSSPATVTITVTPLSTPVAAALSVATTTGTPVLIEAAAEASSPQPLTGLNLATQPAHGTASVSGEQITYTPASGFIGTDTFTYQLSNHFGASALGVITVTVTAAGSASGLSRTVTAQPGSPVSVNLASIAQGTYVSSALLGLSPASAGNVTLSQPATLSFTPVSNFHGLVQITAVLIASNGQSQTVDVLVLVSNQPDPSRNQDVLGLVNAQTMQAERFAQNQLSNIQSRLDSLHDGNNASRFSNNLSINLDGKPLSAPSRTALPDTPQANQGLSEMRPGIGASESFGGESPSTSTPSQGNAHASDKPSSGLGAWINGTANFGTFDAYRQAASFDSDNVAVSAGVDQRIGERALMGFSVGYNHDNSQINHDGTRSVAQGYTAAFYGSYQPVAHVYLDGVLGGGGLRFDSRRHATGNDTALIGHRNGSQWFASLTAGYAYQTGGWAMSPYARLAWSLSSLNGFSESGDAVDALSYGTQTVRTSQAVAGVRASGKLAWRSGWLIPHARLEVGHDFQGTSNASLSYAFVPSAGSWSVLANPYSANGTSLRAGLGGDWQLQDDLLITTEYEYLLMPHARDQSIRIGVQKQF
jgi:outer membrane autotransporter protein